MGVSSECRTVFCSPTHQVKRHWKCRVSDLGRNFLGLEGRRGRRSGELSNATWRQTDDNQNANEPQNFSYEVSHPRGIETPQVPEETWLPSGDLLCVMGDLSPQHYAVFPRFMRAGIFPERSGMRAAQSSLQVV
jgi:hypothetical protein